LDDFGGSALVPTEEFLQHWHSTSEQADSPIVATSQQALEWHLEWSVPSGRIPESVFHTQQARQLAPRTAAVLRRLGDANMLRKDWPEAISDYTSAIEAGETASRVKWQRGIAHWESSQWAQADADFTAAIERGIDDASLLAQRCLARMALGQPDAAWSDARQALQRGLVAARFQSLAQSFASRFAEAQSQAVYWRLVGVLELRGNAPKNAVVPIEKAFSLGDDSPDVHFARAQSRFFESKFDNALADVEAAIQKGLDNLNVRELRGKILRRLNRLAEADADFSQALSGGLRTPSVWQNRAAVRAALNRHADAIDDLTQAIQFGATPKQHWSVWRDRGNSLAATQQYEAAITDYRTALQGGHAGYDDTAIRVAHCLSQLGRQQEAKTELSQAIAKFEQNATFQGSALRIARAEVNERLEQWGDAAIDYAAAIRQWADPEIYAVKAHSAAERALAKNPNHWQVLVARAGVWAGANQVAKAIEDYSAAIERGANTSDVWLQRGNCHYQLANWDAALADYTEVTRRTPAQWQPWAYRGFLLAGRKQFPEAFTSYSEAINRAPDEMATWQNAALVSALAQQPQRYRQICQAVKDKTFNNALTKIETIHTVIWMHLMAPHSVADPAELIGIIDRVGPQTTHSDALRGFSAYRRGEFSVAVGTLTAVLFKLEQEEQKKPSDQLATGLFRANVFLAMAQHQRGETENARASLNEASKRLRRRFPVTAQDKPQFPDWPVRLEWEMLFAEAESLIGPPSAPKKAEP
jgi:tetratricopeptide (TPR) repeat protein